MRRTWSAVACAVASGYVLLQLLGRRARSLVLHSTTHVPAGWRAKFGVSIDWTWCFQVTDLPSSKARVHLRVRGKIAPRWFAWIYQALIVPADYIMALGMLRGIARRAEAHAPPRRSGRVPYTPSTEGTL
jgi:hypothetical protein